jgi:hypothetical protein
MSLIDENDDEVVKKFAVLCRDRDLVDWTYYFVADSLSHAVEQAEDFVKDLDEVLVSVTQLGV